MDGRRKIGLLPLAVVVLWACPLTARAQTVFSNLVPFRKAEPQLPKSFELTDKQGPWLIMATSFSGAEADRQAHELAAELRQKFKLNAYVHKLHFDYTEKFNGLGVTKYGEPRKFKNLNGKEFDEIAVMVGDFSGVDDVTAQKSLETIKTAWPEALNYNKNKGADQKYAALRWTQRWYHQAYGSDPEKKKRGPMGNAFMTRNPLLPEEMFVSKGLDPFIVDMNKDLPYSLLKNPKRYSVKIASFKGVDTMSPKKFDELTMKDREKPKIDQAAEKARAIVLELRKKGVEAYEFHDTTESIVCVGSFDEVGQPRQDGKTEINPAVLKIMTEYGASKHKIPGQSQAQLQPAVIAGNALDYQPLPIEVPRPSFGAQYAKTSRR